MRRMVLGQNDLGRGIRHHVDEGLAVGVDRLGLDRDEQVFEQRLWWRREVGSVRSRKRRQRQPEHRETGYRSSHDSVGTSLGSGSERM